jgi:hypothetical protein
MTNEHIAHVVHEANRAYCVTVDDRSQIAWDDAPEWQRASAIEGIEKAKNGATPEQLHESWCAFKIADGWTHGDVKDADAKTHPCLVPYADLPAEQRVKDHLFRAIVEACAAAV